MPKGAEYCLFLFKGPHEYEVRANCLAAQGIDIDSQFCREKYDYIQANSPESYDEQERWECYAEFNIPNNALRRL